MIEPSMEDIVLTQKVSEEKASFEENNAEESIKPSYDENTESIPMEQISKREDSQPSPKIVQSSSHHITSSATNLLPNGSISELVQYYKRFHTKYQRCYELSASLHDIFLSYKLSRFVPFEETENYLDELIKTKKELEGECKLLIFDQFQNEQIVEEESKLAIGSNIYV